MATTAAEVLTQRAEKKRNILKGTLSFIRHQPVGTACIIGIAIFTFVAIFAPWIRPYSENDLVGPRMSPPSSDFWLGTDNVGRDMFSRILTGARVSLLVGFFSVLIGTLSGALIGITSAYIGGKFDLYMQRLVDAKQAMPTLILAMMLVTILGTGMWAAVIAIGILGIGSGARVVRSAVLSVKQEMYVEAARAIGASGLRIMIRHVSPQIFPLLIVLASISIPGAISTEASLSFLGLGVQPPTPSWGNMLSGAGRQFMEQAPWLVLGPGIAISLVVLAYNLLGDVLRDILDPRLRGTRK